MKVRRRASLVPGFTSVFLLQVCAGVAGRGSAPERWSILVTAHASIAATRTAPAERGDLGIGATAQAVGLSPSTLRAWEAVGLSTPWRDESGRRWYSPGERDRLRQIKDMRESEGLSLRAIQARLQHAAHDVADAPHAPSTEQQVAGRLRSMRRQLDLTVRQVASRTGLSASYVSSVENGSIRPSVASLLKLSQAYGANILSFYGPSPEPRRRLARMGQAEVIAMGDPGVSVALLTPHESALELHLFELAPGAGSGGSYCHEGDEFWYVLGGTLGVWLDDEFFQLEAGDCLSFASTDEHRFVNLGQGTTRFLGANTPSTF
jgi:DNA-binding transcriptional MerR regulator/mannose-6-phosphate isomerase-like protein (cupin superfamily)